MEFGSKYVLVKEVKEKEVFSVDELDSDCEESTVKQDTQAKQKKKGFFSSLFSSSKSEPASNEIKKALPPPKPMRAVRAATTNVLSLDLGTLANDAPLFTGDIIFCECGAAFNKHSALSSSNEKESDGQIWVCEFCNKSNEVQLEEEEIPKEETIDYLLEPPKEKKGDSDSIVVFCLDISGSMCCTTELKGHNLKFKKNKQLEEVSRMFNHLGDQHLPGQDRNVTYISRLQCAVAAIESQIESLALEYPNKRVVIVTFSDEVTIYEPNKKTHVIAGDHLNDYDYLINVADKLNIQVNESVSKSKEKLFDILRSLEERGATALGPALLVSISIAGRSKGSSVILCTDGMANTGLGDLEVIKKDSPPEVHASVAAFYERAGDLAVEKGVAVSIVSIKGTHTVLEYLGKLCTKTGGFNDIVDVLDLTGNFNSLLQNPVIATDVRVKMILHKAFKFHDQSASTKVVEIGNVTKESILSFEFELKPRSVIESLNLENTKQLPFQVVIYFTKLNGAKCVRVMSKLQEITKDRDQAEENVNVAVLARFSTQEAAKLAQEGSYTKARMRSIAHQRLALKSLAKSKSVKDEETYSLWSTEAARLNNTLKKAKKKEMDEGVTYNSEDEDVSSSDEGYSSDEGELASASVPKVKRAKRSVDKKRLEARARGRTVDDESANIIYQASNPRYLARFK